MIRTVSIFILLYKNQELIKPALQSIFSQKIPDELEVELIISDDASPCFDCRKLNYLIDEISRTNKKIRHKILRQNQNLGTVKHLNSVLTNLCGDIIIPLGVDDALYDEYTIHSIVDFFNNNQCLVVTGRRVIYEKGFSKELYRAPSARLDPLFMSEDQSKLLSYMYKNGNVISGASTYYHRELFKITDSFDENYHLLEDFPFYIKLLSSGFRIHLMDRPVIKYQLGGISTSDHINPLLKADFVKLYQKLLIDSNSGKKHRRHIQFKLFKFDAYKLSFFERLGLLDVVFINHLRIFIGRYIMLWRRLRKFFDF
ncbi:glycosyltransferase family 2 protein [Vogesella sp. GCM10023246]|uniref:Glycosyltransferase family 2 protein n=1 Tax=Vogesella oryzagri TaxID=3160864 RepID=A0ABV1MA10_9NEIS